MNVLHAIWDHRLYIWAESSLLSTTMGGKTRRPKSEQDSPHPFTLAHIELQEALGDLVGSLPLSESEHTTLTLRLPTGTKGPLSSPEIALTQENTVNKVRGLRSWKIPALALPPQTALDLLLSLPDHASPSLIWGSSLRFWIEAANLAFELITRQCFIPTARNLKENGEMTATWEVFLDGQDEERARQFSALMPPVCWSFLPVNKQPTTLRASIVRDFLNRTVDAFVRESLNTTPLLSSGRGRRVQANDIAAQWVQALTSPDPRLHGSEGDLKRFANTLHSWLAQLQPIAADAPFRTCFRLDAPTETDPSTWNVGFYLQANDDKSLLIPAQKVWKERSSTLTFLKRKFENPQERLLADLGKASRLFPAIEEALKTARPGELHLNTEQAYAFLRQSAPLLEQSGFGVQVPSWWKQAKSGLGVKLKLRPKEANGQKASSGLLGMNGIVAYDWSIALGKTMLSEQEFEQLVRLKQPLVNVRGQWVELQPETIETAIAFFEKQRASKTMTLGEALRLGLGAETEATGLPIIGLEAEGWLHSLLASLNDGMQITPIIPPSTLQGQLRPYQAKGLSWLSFLMQYGFGACLADDMGLGKCLRGDTDILVNGKLQKIEMLWEQYSSETTFDGEGYWACPTEQLFVNSLEGTTGQIVQAPIRRIYRQHVSTHLRRVLLEDDNAITITYPHKLLTNKGWTNNLHVGDYVCVPAKLMGKHYCKIKAIEDVQHNGWVYDLEVENHHNFVANNILCHNTIQTISLLLHDREQTPSHSPTLLICPMSVVGNWQREIQRFAPSLKAMIHHGNERLSGEAFAAEAQQHDIVITTYALALRDKEHLTPIEWEYVVLDEAQNIKNEAARQTQAIKQLKAQHKIALTGTPVENRLSELWSIIEFLNPGYLGSGKQFRTHFALPIERYHNKERAEQLKQVIQPFVLRRVKTDKTIISDLPEKMEMKVLCNLTQEQASLYEAVVQEMLEKIEQSEGIERKGLILSTLLKLKQVCNHPAQFVADGSSLDGRSGKLARLEEMLEEALAAGDKALIFSQFAEMGGMLRHHLQERFGCEALFLHGGTPKKQRDAMVQRFQEEKRGAPLFILSLKAGGVGLNLTAANHVFHFDRWWNPAVENQATDRAFRIGQKRNVQVHKFLCVGTLEERIDKMIEQKLHLAESIVSSGEGWLTEMSTTQLKELFALSREAVGE